MFFFQNVFKKIFHALLNQRPLDIYSRTKEGFDKFTGCPPTNQRASLTNERPPIVRNAAFSSPANNWPRLAASTNGSSPSARGCFLLLVLSSSLGSAVSQSCQSVRKWVSHPDRTLTEQRIENWKQVNPCLFVFWL